MANQESTPIHRRRARSTLQPNKKRDSGQGQHGGEVPPLKTQSAKAKGRRLQQFVRNLILKNFKNLRPRDVRSTPMGSQGEDIQLSALAFESIPFNIECKNQELSKTVYEWYNQAKGKDGEPLLVIKRNNAKPLVVIDAEYFLSNWALYKEPK